MFMKFLKHSSIPAFLLGFAIAGTATAGTLENMERERAVMIDALLSTEMSAAKRQETIELARNRLVDLERMVLRDKTLTGKTTPAVRAVFSNYDLSFLVHASVEGKQSIFDHWLNQIGVSTDSLLSARAGTR